MSTSYEGFTPDVTLDKAMKFKKTAGGRLATARKAMRLLENTANTRTYYWTEAQKSKIITELERSVEKVRNAFDASSGDENDFVEL